ncbi:MAG: 3'-5' exoribonuclease YhaM [candidate division WS6 bacterium OLB20]|uniref:3'-5' exoribonuclease YhaM n=1 Tax=candidate division WS6 bacterium OLB20 TaxID=1617426 RepID=A0A136M097_9BACT|nr:MAG: 3'-5' exoribonuclease YhaM [candidate division WS6 bacterium OLB20]
MKNLYIADLRQGMSLTSETFAVQDASQQTTKSGKPYYRLTLRDKTGSINGQIWSDSFASIEKKALTPGKVIMVDAGVEEFKGALQLNISKVTGVDETALEEFVEASDFDNDEMWARFTAHLNKIRSESIRTFLDSFFADESTVRRYRVAPAAEDVHHSFHGGMLEHVLEMLDLAAVFETYYPEPNYDVVRAGIMLHDIGKLQELETVGTVVQRTKAGSMLGHIPMGFALVQKHGEGVLTEEELLNIGHIVLSHHGLLEYGSPVKPVTIEASIVSAVDEASSHVRIFQKVLRRANSEGDFTEYDRILGTRVYKNEALKKESLPDTDTNDEQFTLT